MAFKKRSRSRSRRKVRRSGSSGKAMARKVVRALRIGFRI